MQESRRYVCVSKVKKTPPLTTFSLESIYIDPLSEIGDPPNLPPWEYLGSIQGTLSDYCGFGPFSSTLINLMIFISLLKVLIWIIH